MFLQWRVLNGSVRFSSITWESEPLPVTSCFRSVNRVLGLGRRRWVEWSSGLGSGSAAARSMSYHSLSGSAFSVSVLVQRNQLSQYHLPLGQCGVPPPAPIPADLQKSPKGWPELCVTFPLTPMEGRGFTASVQEAEGDNRTVALQPRITSFQRQSPFYTAGHQRIMFYWSTI